MKTTTTENKITNLPIKGYNLSLKSSFYLKGMAITLIMLHNFFHRLFPRFEENEMSWSIDHLTGFFDAVNRFPHLSVEFFWGLMGFFGVPVFVFLSGYGLTKSFSAKKGRIITFVIKHIVKIYLLFLISVGVYTLYNYYQGNLSQKIIKAIFYTLTLTNNFYPNRLFLLNGPWWFFSMIIQLYILFPLIYFILKRKNNLFWILALCYLAIYILLFYLNINSRYIFGNSLGHIPEFTLGCFMAKYADKMSMMLNKYVILACLCITVLSYYFECLFPVSHIMAACCLIGIFLNIEKYFAGKSVLKYFNEALVYIGIVSPYLFGFNGFLRRIFYKNITNKYDLWQREFEFLKWFILCLLLATLFSIPKIIKAYRKIGTVKSAG